MNRYLIAVLFLVSLPGYAQKNKPSAAAMFHAGETHSGVYKNSDSRSFGDVRWSFKTGGKIFSSPAILNGIAYFGSEDHFLYAVDTRNGRLVWKFKTNAAVHSSPAVFQNTVYFSSYDGYFYAVNATNGTGQWKFKTGGERKVGAKGLWTMKPAGMYMEDQYDFFLSSPIVHSKGKNHSVYFGSSDGHLYALNAENGQLKWKFKTNGIIHTSPALENDIVYIGSWDTNLYAVDAETGTRKWAFKTGEQPEYHVLEGIQASPSIKNGLVYFGARDGYFYALDAKTGNLTWKYSADNSWILTTASLKDSTVYFCTSDTYLFIALNARTGAEKFRTQLHGYAYSSPAITENYAWLGDFTGNMYVLDLSAQGKIIDSFPTPGRKANAAKILNQKGNLDFTYTAGKEDPALYATGTKVMDAFYSLGSIVSSPVIIDGVVYFGSADGYFYAVSTKN
jgi:outer membrane protein assembly factor BamB